MLPVSRQWHLPAEFFGAVCGAGRYFDSKESIDDLLKSCLSIVSLILFCSDVLDGRFRIRESDE